MDRHTARGQSTVELALTLPLLVIGALAVAQVAGIASDQVAVHHAVREAARQAAVDPSAAAVERAADRASPRLDHRRLDVTVIPGPGRLVTVRVGYRAPTGVPLVGAMLGDVELTATAVVRRE